MKVLLPVNDSEKNMDSLVHSPDKSEYACIYDTQSKASEFIPMNNISAKIGNLCLAMKRKGIDAMICRTLPDLAVELFTTMGIEIYQANGVTVNENVKNFADKLLPSLSYQYRMASSCSSSSCSSCSSSCG
jgi:predicted Fe-Mo cluster-binding NifX family protein